MPNILEETVDTIRFTTNTSIYRLDTMHTSPLKDAQRVQDFIEGVQ